MLYCNILLIDDDQDDGSVFIEAVHSINADITCNAASNPVAALENLRGAADLPDLIFLDINMPAVSGMDFRKQLEEDERLKDIDVVLYSTYSKEAAEQFSMISGKDRFISKPYTFEALVGILKNIIDP